MGIKASFMIAIRNMNSPIEMLLTHFYDTTFTIAVCERALSVNMCIGEADTKFG